MAKPTKPTVPAAPLRSQPDTFSARAETFLAFWPTFATYLDDVGTFTDEQADAALAAAIGGDLPSLTGKAGQYLRVNAGATAAEFANAVPAGTVIYHAANSAPDGYIKANGAAISRTTYAALFAAIGTTFGAGDGSTTFTLPDMRGEFPRGWDDSRGVDSGRAFGSAQLDQMQRITGSLDLVGVGAIAPLHTGFDVNGAFIDGGASAGTNRINGTSTTGLRKLGFDSASSPSARASSTTAGETRSRNVALLACIKF